MAFMCGSWTVLIENGFFYIRMANWKIMDGSAFSLKKRAFFEDFS